MNIKQKTSEWFIFPAILIISLLLPHILFFDNGYVDLETYVVEAASEIAEHGLAANLSDYFSTVANPLFSALLLSGSYHIFGESHFISRITIFFVAFIFALFLYFYLKNKKGVFIAFVCTLLVIVNPMFIVYSQYVYSDVPFMVFLSISLLLLLYASTAKEKIISSIMLGFSLATKYVAAVLFPVVFIYSLIRANIFSQFSRAMLFPIVRFNVWYFALSTLVSVPIISIVFHFQTGILTPDYATMHTLNVGMFIPRFFSYLLWLGLFIGLSGAIPILDLWGKTGKKKFLMILFFLIVLTLTGSYFFPISSLHIQAQDFGEMNLGWVESVVPSLYLSLAFFCVILVAEIFIVNMIFDLKYANGEKTKHLFFWIVLPIILMSFTRVANRYMLALLVPISLYMALAVYRMYSEGKTKQLFIKATLALHAVIFLAVGFYSNYYLYLRGLAG